MSVAELKGIIYQLDKELEAQLKEHKFGCWLLEQEGIGPRTAASFLGEAGDLSRFESEAKLARYAGNGAVKNHSGKAKEKYRDDKRYNHRLKRAIMLMAQCRYMRHEQSNKYIKARKEEKVSHWKAIKKLARYLIRYLWKSWQKIVNNQGITISEPT